MSKVHVFLISWFHKLLNIIFLLILFHEKWRVLHIASHLYYCLTLSLILFLFPLQIHCYPILLPSCTKIQVKGIQLFYFPCLDIFKFHFYFSTLVFCHRRWVLWNWNYRQLWAALLVYRVLNPVPLEEQSELLTTEPYLQYVFKHFCIIYKTFFQLNLTEIQGPQYFSQNYLLRFMLVFFFFSQCQEFKPRI